MRNIPNIITLVNLFLGCVAVVMAIEGQPGTAAILIIIGSILDFMDGMAARLLRAGSPIGQQLDSLADLVSFGVAPAAIAYQYLVETAQVFNHEGLRIVFPFLAFFLAVFSGLRLAIFNIDSRQTDSFIGLPTPANALFFCSLPFVLAFSAKQGVIYGVVTDLVSSTIVFPAVVLLFSWLLVSPFRMFSLKVKSFAFRENRLRYFFLGGSLVFLLIFGLEAFPLIMIFYIILSLIDHFFNQPGKNPGNHSHQI